MRYLTSLFTLKNSTYYCTKLATIAIATNLCTRLRPMSDKCAVAWHVSRRRENTGRQRQAVPWWCSTTSRRLRLDDLSETELTAGLWESKRYIDTCAQLRYVRPVWSTTSCTLRAVSLYNNVANQQSTYTIASLHSLNLNFWKHKMRILPEVAAKVVTEILVYLVYCPSAARIYTNITIVLGL